jgi:hypothetical protein
LPCGKLLGLHSGKWIGKEQRRRRGQLRVLWGEQWKAIVLGVFPGCHLVVKGGERDTEAQKVDKSQDRRVHRPVLHRRTQ